MKRPFRLMDDGFATGWFGMIEWRVACLPGMQRSSSLYEVAREEGLTEEVFVFVAKIR